MKTDYKNWVPKGMLVTLSAATAVLLFLFLIFGPTGLVLRGTARMVCGIIFGIGFLLCLFFTVWLTVLHRVFDYNGKRKLSKTIIEGTAEYISLPEGGIGLDVGCGSGALTIACAKRNQQGRMIGIDRWKKEYASFSKDLCERNAEAEGVSNVSFENGDATNLAFEDETFDAVTSNYVYHNIAGTNKQKLLTESLRVLKKGGTFAIHDLMSKRGYGDMQEFSAELKRHGYEDVRLIDTADGIFMGKREGTLLGLGSSTLLVGKK